jgi:hypothetical protein
VLADLQVGIEIKVEFDPLITRAFKIEVEEADEEDSAGKEEIRGGIVSIEEGVVTVETEDGPTNSFTVTGDTHKARRWRYWHPGWLAGGFGDKGKV